MPQAVAAVAAWWASWGTYVTIALTAYTAYSANQKRRRMERQARDAYNAGLQDRLNMVSSPDGARSRVYGEVRNVDGVIFKAAHGANSEFYTLVVAIAGHECQSIEKVYFNDQELTLTSDGAGGFWVQTEPYQRSSIVSAQQQMTMVGTAASVTLANTPISGSVTVVQSETGDTGTYSATPTVDGNDVTATIPSPNGQPVICSYQYVLSEPKARVWKYLGTSAQDIGTDLLASRFPSLINTGTNDDRFAGICCLVVELEYDQDAFPLGVPNVTALVRGAKCYDPRTATTVWTKNPAIIARDWSLYAYGGGCVSAELHEAAFTAAANACDVSTDFETPDGTETRPLYQCDIVCKLDAPPDQGWLSEIVESMAGKWGWAGGQLTLVAGVYRAPVATITEDWISNHGDIGLVKDSPLSDLVNVYRPSIANADAPVSGDGTGTTAAYAMAPMPEVRSAAYITADGLELPREIALGGVTHNVHAQHICGVLMRDARYSMTLSLPCKMHAWQLELFDVVYVTLPLFGLAAAQFEVLGWQFDADKGMTLTLKKIDASIFDPDANFDLPNAELNTSLVLPWSVPEVEGLTVTSGTAPLEDGTPQARVLVSWDQSTSASVLQSGKIEVQYAEIVAGSITWLNSPPVDGSHTSVSITGLRQFRHYVFRARQVNTLGVRGAWCQHVLHLVAAADLVGTDLLEQGAATLIYSTYVDDISANRLAYIDLGTAPVDCELIFTAKFKFTITPGTNVGYLEAAWDTQTSDPETVIDDPLSTADRICLVGTSTQNPNQTIQLVTITKRIDFLVADGQQYAVFHFAMSGVDPKPTVAVEDYEFRAELVLR